MQAVVTGFHAIEESVNAIQKSKKNPQNVKLFYSKVGPRVKKILATAKEAGVSSVQVENSKLDDLVKDLPAALQDHRGIVLQKDVQNKENSSANYVEFDSWLKQAEQSFLSEKKSITVVVLDKITDPHNVGAIIRSCDQFGVSLVVIPEHKSSNDIENNDVIARSSAGASAWVPVAIVNNLVRTVEKLKESGFWVYGADAGGETCGKIDFAEKTVLIMGSEGQGISQLLEKQCDTIVSIPTCGKIDSLNVSVAAGVLLYEIFRRKNK